MGKMSISIPKPLQGFIDEQVAARGFASASEYVSTLIDQERDRQKFRDLIQEGIDSEPGEIVDDDWFEALREDIRNAGAA